MPPGGNPPRLSGLPFIPDENWEQNDTQINDGHIIRTDYGILEGRPPRIKTIPPMEYVEHPVVFESVSVNPVIYSPETGSTQPSTSPLDVTMLAMLGLTMAGAGLMKSESAIAKQKEQEAKKAQELAGLQAQLDAQKADASANWEANLAMQDDTQQMVMTQVTQSQANKDFWVAYAIWKAKVALAEAKRRARELAKKKAESQVQVKKPIVITDSMRVMLIVALGVLFLLSANPTSNTQPKADNYLKPYNDIDQSCGLFYPSQTGDTIKCSLGAALTATSAYMVAMMWQQNIERFGTLECWFIGLNCPPPVAPNVGAIPNAPAQIPPYPDDLGGIDELPIDRIFPWIDFLTPEPPDSPEIIAIYRVMSQAELDDLEKNKVFSTEPMNALECKWFADRYEHVLEWEKLFFPAGDGRIVEATVRREDADTWYFVPFLDGIGPARCANSLQLISILSWRIIK